MDHRRLSLIYETVFSMRGHSKCMKQQGVDGKWRLIEGPHISYSY